jgi:hypothetical protein
MLSLGGFRESSVVIMWAALCFLESLLLDDRPRTLIWVVGFVALLIVSAIMQPYLVSAHLPEAFVIWFFRTEHRRCDRHHVRAALLLRRQAKFLSATRRNPVAQHTSQRDFRVAKGRSPHDR